MSSTGDQDALNEANVRSQLTEQLHRATSSVCRICV